MTLTPGPSPWGRGEEYSLSLRERVRVRDLKKASEYVVWGYGEQ